jgi:hypothetical protein
VNVPVTLTVTFASHPGPTPTGNVTITSAQQFYLWDVTSYLLGGLTSASFRVSMDNAHADSQPNEYFSTNAAAGSGVYPELIVSYIP